MPTRAPRRAPDLATLRQAYERRLQEATVLAGGLHDLTQRATVYRQIFRDSGRNHTFPLIAAHGALWARGYFQFGFALARKLVWQYFYSAAKRQQQLDQLAQFADTFRDINRRVCVDTYANFHFTAEHGEASGAAEFVSCDLLTELNHLHHARRNGRALSSSERQSLFTAHFLNEQQQVVGPSIADAVAKLDWPLLRNIALRPSIRFAYFPAGRTLRFRDFTQQTERVANGLSAFQLGAEQGWDVVELRLQDYRLLAARCFTEPETNYAELRAGLLSA